GATAVDGKSAALYSLALPVHAGVLQHSWSKIIHDGGDSLFATESIEERQFSLNLSGLIGRLGGAGAIRSGGFGGDGFSDALFPCTFARAGELLVFCHSLTGSLVGLPATRGKEIVLLLFDFPSAA